MTYSGCLSISYQSRPCHWYKAFHCSIREEPWYAHLVPVLLPLAQIGLTGSLYLTLSISVERFITVKYPFFKVNIQISIHGREVK